MRYTSTRGNVDYSFSEVVLEGLAKDGGLFIPMEMPKVDLDHLRDLDYVSLCTEILSLFATDIPAEDLNDICKKSYMNFNSLGEDDVVPIKRFDNFYIAELFHGPTFAFKDLALQFLGNLFEYLLKKNSSSLNILGATSGDTGSAAIYGVKGKENINIFITYPDGKVSDIQELQMTSVEDKNVYNIAINGTFDDCQNIVKQLMNEADFKEQYSLGAVNSINWARIAAQIVYYFYVYFKVSDNNEDKISFSVPTGNFGNVLAGYYAKRMGLPIDKLIVATNENDILARFIEDGDYSLADVKQTYSPSMDIQVSSNLERYIYELFDKSPERVSNFMEVVSESNGYQFTDEELREIKSQYRAFTSSDKKILSTIKDFYEITDYIVDPHTATGLYGALRSMEKGKVVVMATAHPAKFPETIEKAIGVLPEVPKGLEVLSNLQRRYTKLSGSKEVKDYIMKNIQRSEV